MDAVILAGGFGKRILPLSHYYPKPMLPIANVPTIDYLVAQAVTCADNLIFTVAHKPETLMAFVNGYIGLNARFALEVEPLGTAGGVKNARPDGDFFVLSGDGISDVSLAKMARLHENTGADITIAVKEVNDLTGFGRVVTAGDYVKSLREKNSEDCGKNGLANTGIYYVSHRVLSEIDGVCDFARDLFPALLNKGRRIAAYVHDGYWRDIGSSQAYLTANTELIGQSFYPEVPHLDRRRSRLIGSNLIGSGAIVTGRATRSVIGEDSVICSSADVDNCVVLAGSIVGGVHRGEIIGTDFCFKAENPSINLYNLHKMPKNYML